MKKKNGVAHCHPDFFPYLRKYKPINGTMKRLKVTTMYELKRIKPEEKPFGTIRTGYDELNHLWVAIEKFIRATKEERFPGYVSVRENGKLVLFMKMDPNDCIRAVGRTDEWRDWVEQLAPMFYG